MTLSIGQVQVDNTFGLQSKAQDSSSIDTMESLEGVLLRRFHPNILRKILLHLSNYEDVLSCLTISKALHDLIIEQVIQDTRLERRLATWRESHVWTSPDFELCEIKDWKLLMNEKIRNVTWETGEEDLTWEDLSWGHQHIFNKAGGERKHIVRCNFVHQVMSMLGSAYISTISVANGNDNDEDKYLLFYEPSPAARSCSPGSTSGVTQSCRPGQCPSLC